MKFCLFVCMLVVAPFPANAAESAPPEVRNLIEKTEALNDRCRGGSGDDPATWTSCNDRDKIIGELGAKGWCWGTDDQFGADKSWQRCSQTSSAANALPSPNKSSANRGISREASDAIEIQGGDNYGGDPYYTGQKTLKQKKYAKARAVFLEQLKIVYFAAGCRVISTVEANLIGQLRASGLFMEATGVGVNTFDEKIESLMRASAQEGVNWSKRLGCDYWQRNPEQVANIRREAQLATMY